MISLSLRVLGSLALIIALMALAGRFRATTESDRDNPGLYRNEKHGFSIRYPADWQVEEGFMGTTVIGKRPRQGLSLFQESVAVTAVDLETPRPFQEFFTGELARMKEDLTDFSHEPPTERSLGEQGAVRLVYEHRYAFFDLKAVAYFLSSGKKGYIITCTGRPDSFEDFLERFESVAGTFAPGES